MRRQASADGNVSRTRRVVKWPVLSSALMRLLRDAQFAVRTLTRTPGFTLVVVLTLALGIGASASIFSVVNAVVLRPLDYPEPARLVRITSELRAFGATDTGVTAAELADYQERGDLFASVAGMVPVNANVTSGDTPERVAATGELRIRVHEWRGVGTTAEIAAGLAWRLPSF